LIFILNKYAGALHLWSLLHALIYKYFGAPHLLNINTKQQSCKIFVEIQLMNQS